MHRDKIDEANARPSTELALGIKAPPNVETGYTPQSYPPISTGPN
jgi:hypothetical protein